MGLVDSNSINKYLSKIIVLLKIITIFEMSNLRATKIVSLYGGIFFAQCFIGHNRVW